MRPGTSSSFVAALAGLRGRSALALAMLTAAALLAALALAGPARASSIFFIREANIWVANPDGSGARQITTDGSTEPYVAVSSAQQGSAPPLAFHQANNSDAADDLYGTIAPDGSGKAVDPYDSGPNMWQGVLPIAPSVAIDTAGDRIAWSYRYVGSAFLAGYEPDSVAVNGTGEAHIEPGLATAMDVSFGDPGGSSLLFDASWSDEPPPDAYPASCGEKPIGLVREVPGPAQTPLAHYCAPGVDLIQPALRPDGQLIAAAASTGSGPARIVTVPIGGGATASSPSPLSYVTPAGLAANDPVFSPDGTEIAFQGPGGTVYTVPASGGAPAQILTNAAAPAWSSYSLPALPVPPPKPGPHGSSGALAAAKLASRSVRRGRPVVLKVTLRAAVKIKVRLLRRATPHGRSHKPRYVAIGKLTFRGRAGSNTLRITKVHGHRLAPGRYEALVSAGGKARTFAFTVGR